jgi:hypothetical protein
MSAGFGLGVTVTDVILGPEYAAVTVSAAFMVTVQVTVLALVQPVHAEKVLLPEVAGAVKVTEVPAS